MKDFLHSLPDRIDRFAERLMDVKRRRPEQPEEKALFATFQDRVIASVIDTAIIYLLLQDVFRFITLRVFAFADIARVQASRENAPIDGTIPQTIRYYIDSAFASGLFELWLLNSFLQSLVIGGILVLVWREFHSTPGKYIIGLEFAGKNGEGKPKTQQYLWRFIGFYLSMPVLMIGFASLGLDKQKRAWHDRIAGTTVIYAERGNIFRQAWNWLKRQF